MKRLKEKGKLLSIYLLNVESCVIGGDQRGRHANLANGHSQRRDGRKDPGTRFLTVCRLNVLGPLFNQLTYCLCGRQPLVFA